MIFTTQQNLSCCAPQTKSSYLCPTCEQKGQKLQSQTIKAQLKKALLSSISVSLENFNFCTNATCDTVYYADDRSVHFGQSAIKTKVTLKNSDPKTPLCYCRKLLKEDVYKMINNKETNISQKVRDIIASGKSVCEKSNPKGICCTEDVKYFLETLAIPWEADQTSKFSIKPPS